jgi:hypothetical protein
VKAILIVLAAVVLCSCSGPASLTDEEAVARDLAALTFEDFAGANTAEDNIRFDLALPASGANGTTIAWSSSAPGVIAVDGTLADNTSETGVTLTATASRNLAADDKAFPLTVLERVALEWGTLQAPLSTTTAAGVASENIYGVVYELGVTDNPGQGSGITAQLGYGPDGSDPSAGGWTWTAATYNTDNGDNDVYRATLTIATEGFYAYAYRFSGDNGNTWLYCDSDGSDNGYDPAKQGELTVNP